MAKDQATRIINKSTDEVSYNEAVKRYNETYQDQDSGFKCMKCGSPLNILRVIDKGNKAVVKIYCKEHGYGKRVIIKDQEPDLVQEASRKATSGS